MSELEPGAEPTRVRRDRSRLRAVAVVLALFLVFATVLSLTGEDGAGPRAGDVEASAGCDPVVTTPTDLNRTHKLLPSELDYSAGPPAFGAHLTGSAGFERAFYTAQDRPEVGQLVHSMEHGFTVLWYDDTAAEDDDAMATLRELAEEYQLARVRFIVAPWHPADGGPMPADRHYALTRWSADADAPGNQFAHRGNWQYCGTPDPDDIAAFLERWPNEESPEPGVGLPEQSAV